MINDEIRRRQAAAGRINHHLAAIGASTQQKRALLLQLCGERRLIDFNAATLEDMAGQVEAIPNRVLLTARLIMQPPRTWRTAYTPYAPICFHLHAQPGSLHNKPVTITLTTDDGRAHTACVNLGGLLAAIISIHTVASTQPGLEADAYLIAELSEETIPL